MYVIAGMDYSDWAGVLLGSVHKGYKVYKGSGGVSTSHRGLYLGGSTFTLKQNPSEINCNSATNKSDKQPTTRRKWCINIYPHYIRIPDRLPDRHAKRPVDSYDRYKDLKRILGWNRMIWLG